MTTTAATVRSLLTREGLSDFRARHGRRLVKYFAGSVAALIVSTVTFTATFGPGVLGSRGASLTASAAGAVVNYFLNRYWAWERRGRADFRREVVPYWTTVVVNAVLAAVVTGAVNAVVRDMTDDRTVRTLINTLAYVGTYGVSFVLKYWIFHRVFSHHHVTDLVAAEREQSDPKPTVAA